MKTRQISLKEIQQLVKAAETSEHHAAFKDFALAYFGDSAYKVVVEVTAEYNDNTHDDRISEVRAYDQENKQILIDKELPVPKAEIDKYIRLNQQYYTDPKYTLTRNRAWENVWSDVISNLPIPLGREDHNDEDFEAKYTFMVKQAAAQLPKILLVTEE